MRTRATSSRASVRRPGTRRPRAAGLAAPLALGLVLALLGSGCATLADHRKLEYEVARLKRQQGETGPGDTAVADLRSELQALRRRLDGLEGRFEETEHRVDRALDEARAAREAAARPGGPGPAPSEAPAAAEGEEAEGAGEGASASSPPSEEVAAYRRAYDAWRSADAETCVDRFSEFLQAYPSSEYADDAAYWMADCHFKLGDYQTAILRFDDVVSRHPRSPKASEALFRQGEALLRLGPRYGKAAEKAFERVIDEYPDSPRAEDAARELEALGTG